MEPQGNVLRLGLRYCGGCNPEIDRKGLVERLCRMLEAASVTVVHVADPAPADMLLLVNGCPHACREEELAAMPAALPWLSVQGAGLRHRRVPEERLPQALFEMIMSFLSSMPTA